jgi:hypothetical protein
MIDPAVYEVGAVLIALVLLMVIILRKKIAERRRKETENNENALFRSRYDELYLKYGDNDTVARIMNNSVWMGMTKEQLHESLGPPADISRKVRKSKTSEEYKYGRVGGNRFKRRVKIENDVVVGWSNT